MADAYGPLKKPEVISAVTDNDRMAVPLYHGTSMLFLPSIQSGGLGAKDPNVTFRTRAMLVELVGVLKLNWNFHKSDVDHMIDQSVTAGGFSYRYDNVYLSPGQRTAVKYALTNRYGSELLSTTFQMFEKLKEFERLKECDVHGADEIIEKFPELLELYEMPHQPLLIEALYIPIRNLRSKRGEDPSDTLSHMRESQPLRNELNDPWDWYSFELTAPHPAQNLKFYRIEHTNMDFIFPEYSLKIV